MRRDDRAQPRREVADGRPLQDADLLRLSRPVQLDQDGRCAVAAAQARDTLDLDPRLAAELAGNGLERRKASRRAPEVASDVAADVNFDIRRRLQPEVREEADHLVNPVQRDIEPGREALDLLPWQVANSLLDRTKLLDEHEISRRSVGNGRLGPASDRRPRTSQYCKRSRRTGSVQRNRRVVTINGLSPVARLLGMIGIRTRFAAVLHRFEDST